MVMFLFNAITQKNYDPNSWQSIIAMIINF